jgi:hypothetical protein
MTREQLFNIIVAEKPFGFFDEVRPLLDLYVDVSVRRSALVRRMVKTPIGTPEASAITDELVVICEQSLQLATILKLLPGDPTDSPPRMQ